MSADRRICSECDRVTFSRSRRWYDLLFLFLSIKGSVPDDLKQVTDSLLNSLSLLFVPAGVGVMAHFTLLGSDAIPLSIALIVSTVLTIVVTASVMTFVNKYLQNSDSDANE